MSSYLRDGARGVLAPSRIRKVSMKELKGWWVYMVRCSDSSLYSGVTTDTERRVGEHNGKHESGKDKGAKYTKARRPVTLVYKKRCKDRSTAGKAEAALRKLTKAEKEKLTKT